MAGVDKVNPRAGGAPRAHVDALKLLAVFVQHSDSSRSSRIWSARPDA